MTPEPNGDLERLTMDLKRKAIELGFQDCAITQPDMTSEKSHLREWLSHNYHGEMGFLAEHFEKRIDPTLLVPGTTRVIMLRMDYLPSDIRTLDVLANPNKAYVARYALGRDYHKLIRKRIKHLGEWLSDQCEEQVKFRPFVDSAPVLERPLAKDAGLGWIGKHTLLLNRSAGSWFFLGSLFTNIALPLDEPLKDTHCGSCTACLDVCPTQAFPTPYTLDARRCISYLTIEFKGSIPLELRPLMGNRIFGCDDCQLICPWNRFAKHTEESDFKPRHQLDDVDLLTLFSWNEVTFLDKTQGSAIRRTGFIGWQRNIAVALGNSKGGQDIEAALEASINHSTTDPLVKEHALWALNRLRDSKQSNRALPILDHPGVKRVN